MSCCKDKYVVKIFADLVMRYSLISGGKYNYVGVPPFKVSSVSFNESMMDAKSLP